MVIVGGGPSVSDYVDELRNCLGDIFAINDAHNWLLERGVVPKACVLGDMFLDVRKTLSGPDQRVSYFCASQCDPAVFQRLSTFSGELFHMPARGLLGWLEQFDPFSPRVYGGRTMMLRSLFLGYLLGYRNFRLYGADSSFKEQAHAYAHPYAHRYKNEQEFIARSPDGAMCRFKSTPELAQQAYEYGAIQQKHRFNVTVRGDGLLPWIHNHL